MSELIVSMKFVHRTRWHTPMVCLLVVCTAMASSTAADDENPQSRGYVGGLRLEKEAATLAWRYESKNDLASIGLSSVCLMDGVVYVGDELGILRAFRSADGKLLWEHNHGERIYVAPVCDGERVYVSTSKWIEAVSCEDGKSVWKQPIYRGGEMALWPRRAPGKKKVQMLYVGGADGIMYGYLAWSGVCRWKISMMNDVPPDPEGFDGERARLGDSLARPRGVCTDGRTVYQGIFDQSRVVAFDGANGDQRWSFSTKGWVGAAPAVDGNDVFIGSQDTMIYCVNKDTGEKKWEFPTGSRIAATPVVRKNRVFASSCDGRMYCIDRKTGAEVWRYADPNQTRRSIYCDPIVTDDSVYFAVGPGLLYSVNTENGELIWKMRPLPDSELYADLVTDGKRLFTTSRPRQQRVGVAALVAIGPTD